MHARCEKVVVSLLLVALSLVALPAVAQAAPSGGGPTVTTQVVTSFDGTPILTTLFVPTGVTDDDPAPLVLQTHGWGGTGQQTPGGFVGQLLDAGYVVLTWDQRGFGCSGGEVAIDKPALEGRDTSALIDWAVANAPVEVDGDGDPLVGMTGGSYAGGIQTATAAFDDRIDAIAPEISWHDLRYSLYAGDVVNQGWAALLYAAGLATATGLGLSPECPTFPQVGSLDPLITQGFLEGAASGTISGPVLDFFGASSLAVYGEADPVAIPTLVIQGSVDTLFDLTDGHRVYEHVRATGAPAKLIVFCGGHVGCPATYADADDGAHSDAAVLTWFARHLRGDASVDTGAPVEYRTNEGVWRSAASFPPAGFTTATAEGAGSLVSVPILEVPDPGTLEEQLEAFTGGGIPATPITAAQVSPLGDLNSLTVPLGAAGDAPVEVVGIPEVELTVSGLGTDVVLLAKLVDRESNHVINLQEGSIRVPLLDGEQTVSVPMPGVAYTLPTGHHLDLQVSTASLMHANARLPAQVDV
ncbi:MAG: CocE/NonD family hydrolase, partial [Acidimicrobiales bacterium]